MSMKINKLTWGDVMILIRDVEIQICNDKSPLSLKIQLPIKSFGISTFPDIYFPYYDDCFDMFILTKDISLMELNFIVVNGVKILIRRTCSNKIFSYCDIVDNDQLKNSIPVYLKFKTKSEMAKWKLKN